jgi:hypothetical protein
MPTKNGVEARKLSGRMSAVRSPFLDGLDHGLFGLIRDGSATPSCQLHNVLVLVSFKARQHHLFRDYSLTIEFLEQNMRWKNVLSAKTRTSPNHVEANVVSGHQRKRRLTSCHDLTMQALPKGLGKHQPN